MMKKSQEQMEKYKIGLVAVLLTGVCLSAYYFHMVLETGAIIAHAFYIPVILAAFWWKKKGLIVAAFSSVFLLFSHFFLRPEAVTANDYWRALFLVVTAVIVAMLSERIALVTGRLKHLNLILLAIRNVNQLIAREKDRDRLLQGLCDNLIETGGYHNAWIALLDKSGSPAAHAEAGSGNNFPPLLELLKRGELPDCARRALARPEVVTIEDPSLTCAGCPMAEDYHGKASKAVRLEHRGKVYGVLVASIPGELTEVGKEHGLFKEVADDIAFALKNIELEKELDRAQEQLRKHRDQLEELVEERTGELRESEKKLRRISAYTRGLIETSLDPLVTISPKGKITDVNEATVKVTGVPREQLINSNFCNYFTEPKKADEGYKQVLSKGAVVDYPLIVRHKMGKLTPVLYNASVYRDKDGKVLGVFAAARDITEQKKAEEELKRSYDKLKNLKMQLIQSEKLSAIGLLAAGLTHELNSPLNGLLILLRMGIKNTREGTREREKSSAMIEAAEHMANIVKNLASFARVAQHEFAEVDLREVIESALSFSSYQLTNRKIEIIKRFSDSAEKISGDKSLLQQVVLNMITNARDAMPEGGAFSITIENSEDKKNVLMEFSDTGCGIKKEEINRIFDPFFTTKKPGEGVGLGLSVTYGIIKDHGGEISVESEPGRGTKFTISFPVLARSINKSE